MPRCVPLNTKRLPLPFEKIRLIISIRTTNDNDYLVIVILVVFSNMLFFLKNTFEWCIKFIRFQNNLRMPILIPKFYSHLYFFYNYQLFIEKLLRFPAQCLEVSVILFGI
jgi:hypothetical protein